MRSPTGRKNADPQMLFGGIMKGNITLSDVYDNLLFESNVQVSDFMLNNKGYGLVDRQERLGPTEKGC
ncbi:MAG: hypothetical protein MZV63_61465 [Marinilabiliales bacterium]|nr:hypothetical protein [Marinilabiliales bacterium]